MPQWIIYALLSALFAGVTSVLAKIGLKEISSDTGVAIRTVVVLILVSLNAFYFHGIADFNKISITSVTFLIVSGITTALSWIFYYRAIQLGDVSVVASIDKTSLIITILLSILFLKEPVTMKVIIGGSLIVAGTIVLIWK